jgi:hypothetical protein
MKAGEALGAMKYCFPAGTLVDTLVGPKPIEQIRPEERVWGFDLVSCTWRPCLVLQTFCQDYEGRSVKVGVVNETIEATYLHPFWIVRGENLENRPCRKHLPPVPVGSKMPGRWVDAGDLLVGDELLLRDGRVVAIDTLSVSPYHDKVYNLDVDGLHCYAVGNSGTLVHNSNGSEGAGLNPEIPAGSTGGVGAGKRIPQSLTDQHFPQGQSPPNCGYCRQNPAGQLDHVKPRIDNGDLTPPNIVPACPHCNASKGARPAPKSPPSNFQGTWPPPWWPQSMKDWWDLTYGT